MERNRGDKIKEAIMGCRDFGEVPAEVETGAEGQRRMTFVSQSRLQILCRN